MAIQKEKSKLSISTQLPIFPKKRMNERMRSEKKHERTNKQNDEMEK